MPSIAQEFQAPRPERLDTTRARPLGSRLTIVVVAVAAVSAAVLAVTSLTLTWHARNAFFVERSLGEARAVQAMAAPPVGGVAVLDLVSRYRPRPGLVVAGDVQASSGPFSIDSVPAEMRAGVRRGQVKHARVTVEDEPYLVVGAQTEWGAEIFLFFSRQELIKVARAHAMILSGGWLAVVAAAVLVGRRVARRTLRPLSDGARAARAVAAGLLDTRLPSTSDDEFAEWTAAFNQMAAALAERIAREQRFAGIVAHELRNPLTTLTGTTSVLEEELEQMPPQTRRAAELLITDCRRLFQLVDELLEISRLQYGREVVHAEAVDLRAAVEGAVKMRGHEAQVRVEGESVKVETDGRRLDRIIGNLVENAVSHGAGADVHVTIARTGDGAAVTVADRGPGVRPDQLAHLFTPFYRTRSGDASRGTGLGLAIAAENARLLGGEITVASELGRGSEFTVRLPAHPPPGPADERASPTTGAGINDVERSRVRRHHRSARRVPSSTKEPTD